MTYDLKALDFDAIQRMLDNYASTPYGSEAARNLEPPDNVQIARQMQNAVSAARRLIDAQRNIHIEDVPNIRASLKQAASPGTTLNPTALANILSVMALADHLGQLLNIAPDLYPGERSDLLPNATLRHAIDKTVTPRGAVKEDASETLEALWHGFYQQRDEVQRALKKLAGKQDIRAALKDPERIHWQGARAMFAVKNQKADQIKGVRRGSDMGGMDPLIEPIEVVGVNNQLEKASQKITAEQQKLLREVTAHVHDELATLEKMLDAITWIDLALAAGQLSEHTNSHAPQLLDEARVDLRQAYHPLLLMQFIQGTIRQPVPVTLHLDEAQQFLLITGPNTGGKTIALKTLGLLVLMAQCGLHIPAEEDCRIGWFNEVMVDMGDKQSLYHQLSTFAGHVEMMKRILEHAGRQSLLLLDELGTGTDPDEGAALAMAVLDELAARGCQGIVNTHLSPLKEFAEERAHICNAAMVFDEQTLAPTYELKLGASGVSLGLTIAERNGMPGELIANARQHLQHIKATQGQD